MENRLKSNLVKIKISSKEKAFLVDLSGEINDGLLDRIAALLMDESCIIQLMVDGAKPAEALEFAKKVQNLCAEFESTLIIKGRSDIALAANADGVLLDKYDILQNVVYDILGENALIGFCVANDDEITSGYDYICIETNIGGHGVNLPCFIKTGEMPNITEFSRFY